MVRCSESHLNQWEYVQPGSCSWCTAMFVVQCLQILLVVSGTYFVTFTDGHSCCCAIYFMKYQSKVLTKFKEFEALTTNDCGLKIAALRTDNVENIYFN